MGSGEENSNIESDRRTIHVTFKGPPRPGIEKKTEEEDESCEDAEDNEKGIADFLASQPLIQVCLDIGGFAPIIEDNVYLRPVVTKDVDRLKSNCKDDTRNYQDVENEEATNFELNVFDQMSQPQNLLPVSLNTATDLSDVNSGDVLNTGGLVGDKIKQVGEIGIPNALASNVLDGLAQTQPSVAAQPSWANVVATNGKPRPGEAITMKTVAVREKKKSRFDVPFGVQPAV
ncbi:hypothetical protein U1Q18_035932 [Sarracenia purpurea var. burkii]